MHNCNGREGEKICCMFFTHTLTHSANNYTTKAKRKTIIPADIFSAADDMEFKEFLPEMKECLEGMGKINIL